MFRELQIITQSCFQAIILATVLLHGNAAPENDTLVITANQEFDALYIDGTSRSLPFGEIWNVSDSVQMDSHTRLIAFTAYSLNALCAGVLASSISKSIITDARFKCMISADVNWEQLGFDDSNWPNAFEYGDNIDGHSTCTQKLVFDNIDENAKWIWADNRVPSFVVYCRGYTSLCELSSPCLNNGTCLKNDQAMCSCLPQFTGQFCEQEVSAESTSIYLTTEAAVAEPVRILTITAKSSITELYVDDIKVFMLNEDRWQMSDDVVLKQYDRLLSVTVTDTSYSCAGILASVTDDFLVTDVRWKCSAQTFPGWYALGFNDSSWSDAYVIGRNGEVTTPSECNILTEIPSISKNASWIWTASIANAPVYDPVVFCRGYLPICDLDSPCLNGGICNRNDPELCTCASGASGRYCEIFYPFNAAALVGETVIMKCQRAEPHISWWFTRPGFTTPTLIVSDCNVLDEFSFLYAVDKTDGACNLVMSSVGVRHAGTYTCEDTTTDDNRTSAQLTVLNGVQQCWFSPTIAVYGQTVTFTCQLAYSGNWVPAIRWTDIYGQTVTNATTDTTNSSVTSSIVIPAYFPTVPSFKSTVFFDASSLPDVTDDIEADNTPTNIYNDATPLIDVDCPSGFTRTSQYHCYHLIFELLDWFGAQARCQQLYPGAYLVVISDAPEQTDILNYIAEAGATDHIRTSGYTTTYPCYNFAWQPLPGFSLPMTYTNWGTGEPGCNTGSEPSMVLWYSGYTWTDVPDTLAQYSLCEYELSPK